MPEQAPTALGHLRVVDLTTEIATLGVRMLSGFGAQVTRVEPPGGDPLRNREPVASGVDGQPVGLYWLQMMHGRRCLELDLASDTGREAFLAILDGADVVVESQPRGTLEAVGLGYAQLGERYPKLIWTTVSPFGLHGPRAGWGATDLIGLAAGGLLSLCGDPDRPPLRLSVEQAYAHAGLQAAVGTLIALHARNLTGRGQLVDVSMQEAVALCLGNARLVYELDGIVSRRAGGGRAFGAHGARLVYPCRDGHVAMTRTPDQMATLHGWLRESGFEPLFDPAEWARMPQSGPGMPSPEKFDEFTRSLLPFFATRNKMDLYEEGQARGLMLCPVSTPADLLANPQLIDRGYWQERHVPELGRTILVPGAPVVLSATPWRDDPTTTTDPLGRGMAHDLPRNGEPAASQVAADPPVRWMAHQVPGPGDTADSRPQETSASDVSAPPGDTVPPPDQPPPPSTTDSRGILAGLRVADFSWVGVGPISTQVLAMLGAEVVRVESATRLDSFRTGEPRRGAEPDASAYWANCNRDKLGFALNLKHPRARQVGLRLAARADVVVESFTPGFMHSIGLSYEDIRAANPGAIVVSCSMEGATGPHAQFRGFGLVLQSTAGFTHFTSWPDRAPVGTGVAYTDWATTIVAAFALLAAIEHRRRTGQGQYIDLSQLEACIWNLDAEILRWTVSGELRATLGNRHAEMAPHGVFPCSGNDHWIAVAIRDDGDWARLVELIGDTTLRSPSFATVAGRREAEDEIEARLASWSAGFDKHALAEHLQAAGLPAYAVATVADVEHDPQLRARGHFWRIAHAEIGEVDWDAPPYRLSATPLYPNAPAPLLGEHTFEVCTELLGYGAEEVAELVAEGVLE